MHSVFGHWLADSNVFARGAGRDRKRFLSLVCLAALALGVAGTLSALVAVRQGAATNSLLLLLLPILSTIAAAIGCVLSRSPYLSLAAIFAIGALVLLTWSIALSLPGHSVLLAFLLVPVILSSILLSLFATIMILVCSLAGTGLLMLLVPQLSSSSTLGTLALVLLAGSLIVLSRTIVEQDLHRLEQQSLRLATSEEYFRSLLDNSSDLVIVLKPDMAISYVNPSIRRILGYEPDQVLGKPFSDYVHLEDLPNVLDALAQTMQQHQDAPLPLEGRVRRQDGTWRVLRAVGANALDHPAVRGVVLNMRDVTREKQAEEALRASDQYARSIIASSLDMIITTDTERGIVEFNQAAQDAFGYTQQEVMGKNIRMLYDDSRESESIRRSMSDEDRFGGEVLFRRKNGERFVSLLSAALLRDPKGSVIGTVRVARDITERKQEEEQLRYLSIHDALTGLYNRAFLEKEMLKIESDRRYPVSMIMADVNHLKVTNDTLGHAAGDMLLRRAAVILQGTFRSIDIVARIGGDEFVVLMPFTDVASAGLALQRLRDHLAGDNQMSPVPALSLSFGVATAEHSMLLPELLKQADMRMYEDKRKADAN